MRGDLPRTSVLSAARPRAHAAAAGREPRSEPGSQDKGDNRGKVVATPGALAALEASGESLFGVPKSPFAFNSRVHSPMLLALDRFVDVVLSQCAAACVSLYERRHSHQRE